MEKTIDSELSPGYTQEDIELRLISPPYETDHMKPTKGEGVTVSEASHFDSLGDKQWEARHFGDARPQFIKGMELCEIFFHTQVQPIIREFAPQIPIAAGRLDYGSDVLGYDTELSRDHAWGPQVTLYLQEADLKTHKDALDMVEVSLKHLMERNTQACNHSAIAISL